MKIIIFFSEKQLTELHGLYQQVWWAKDRSYEQARKCVEGSQLCLGIIDEDGRLVGFARVLTDFIFKAVIFDVIVCQSKRGAGLGEELMYSIQNHPKLNEVKHFELYCLPEMEAYYEHFGFSKDVGGVTLMRQSNP